MLLEGIIRTATSETDYSITSGRITVGRGNEVVSVYAGTSEFSDDCVRNEVCDHVGSYIFNSSIDCTIIYRDPRGVVRASAIKFSNDVGSIRDRILYVNKIAYCASSVRCEGVADIIDIMEL